MQQALTQEALPASFGLGALNSAPSESIIQTANQGSFAVNTLAAAAAATVTAVEQPELVTLTFVVAASDISAALPGLPVESTQPATPVSTTSSVFAYSASPSIKVAAIPSIAIKPIVAASTLLSLAPTAILSTSLPTSTATTAGANNNGNGNDNGLSGFLQSLAGSPVNIALTVLVCIGILVLIIATIAFFVRRARKQTKKRGLVARSVGTYSDIGSGSEYDDDAQLVRKVSLPLARDQQTMSEKYGHFQQQHQREVAPLANSIIDLDNTDELENEDWNREMLQERRRSSLDMSLVQHLRYNQPFSTPSVFHESSSASQIFNYAATVASSPYLEPSLGPQLRSTYLGSFSASVPTGPSTSFMALPAGPPAPDAASVSLGMLQVPARPNRPVSLTRSVTHAIEHELAVNPPSPPQYVAVPLGSTSRSMVPVSVAPPVQSAWGVSTISQVFNASAGAVNNLLAAAPQSPSYDEEKADRFTALPGPITGRRPSTRWGSFASTTSNAPDRKIHQQMPSRFSVTTLGTVMTNSPTQSAESASVYGDWHLRSAQRQAFVPSTVPRRPIPELIAQREPTPPTSDDGEATPSTTQGNWANTAPLATSTRPPLDRLASVRSTATVQSSIYSLVDPEEDGYGMTEEEQREMKKLIQKRRAAAMAAR